MESPKNAEDMKVRGYTLNMEYFTEVLHMLREKLNLLYCRRTLDVPRTADTRDVNAIKRLAAAYLRLLFPHVRQASDIDKRL